MPLSTRLTAALQRCTPSDQRWRRLARGAGPILAGPWRSEVGYEVLYWIPWLHAMCHRYSIDPNCVIAIGRGGSAAWYGVAGRADLYEFLPLNTVRTLHELATAQHQTRNQYHTDPWEPHVCALTAAALGIVSYDVVSPHEMFRALEPYWRGERSLAWLLGQTRHAIRLPAPPLPEGLTLPPRYVAMRWYVRPTWPHHEATVYWTRRLIERIAARVPVILIDAPHLLVDDHADQGFGEIAGVTRLSSLTPQTAIDHLAIQSAVVARAAGYVGTYGGMAQAASRWGVPTIALFKDLRNTSSAHLTLSEDLARQCGVPWLAGTPETIDRCLDIIK